MLFDDFLRSGLTLSGGHGRSLRPQRRNGGEGRDYGEGPLEFRPASHPCSIVHGGRKTPVVTFRLLLSMDE